MKKTTQNAALLLVDLQNDFMPAGALPVTAGDEVIPIANQLQKKFDHVIASKDWHPQEHGSFASNHPQHQQGELITLAGLPQILWSDHCVQNTLGAEFVTGLDTRKIKKIFYKGTDAQIDSYSTFFDNAHRRSTGLEQYLKDNHISDVYIMGLATDYCVKFSVLDSCLLGFKTYVITDGCRGVNLQAQDSEKAFLEMQQAGAVLINAKDIESNFLK